MRNLGATLVGTATHLHNANADVNKANEELKRAIDSSFKSLRGEGEYERIAFDKKEDLEAFLDSMGIKQTEAIALNEKVNGQYLVELPKENAKEYIEQYTNATGKTPERQKEPENENQHLAQQDLSNGIQTGARTIASHLDVLGNVMCNAMNLYHSYNSYGLGSNDRYLNSFSDSILHTSDDTLQAGRSQIATVVGDTVLINGEVVTGKRADEILERHEERMSKVLALDDDNGKKADVLSNIYGQEYVVESGIEGIRNQSAWNTAGLDSICKDINSAVATIEFNNKTTIIEIDKGCRDVVKQMSMKLKGLSSDETKVINKILASSTTSISLTMEERQTLELLILKASTEMPEIKTALKLILDRVGLNSVEKATLMSKNGANAVKVMQAEQRMKLLSKELGLPSNFSKLSAIEQRQMLLKMNAGFILKAEKMGIQLIKFNGKMDIKALESLTPEQLKKLGISKESLNVLIKINKNGSFGFNRLQALRNVKRAVGGTFGKLFSKTVKDEDISAFKGNMRHVKRATHYTKRATVKVYKHTKAFATRLNAKRIEHAKKRGIDLNAKKKLKAQKKASVKKKVNPKRNARYIKRQQRRLKWADRIKNNPINKFKRKVDAFKKKLTQIAFKLALCLLGIFFLVAMTMVVVVVVISVIQALTEKLNDIGTAVVSVITGTDDDTSIAFALYEGMKDEEDAWVKDISNFKDLYNQRDFLKYSNNISSLESYISSLGDGRQVLVSNCNKSDSGKSTSTISINPFHSIEGTEKDENLLSEISDFDGEQVVSISANINTYGTTAVNDYKGTTYCAVENGHTSNIKDIISMVDVMYQMNLGSKNFKSILDLSPAGLEWENLCSEVKGTFKWIAGSICSLFTEKEAPDWFATVKGDTTDFKTVQNYAMSLFETSHQQYIYLDVKYYPVKSKLDIKGMNKDDKNMKTSQADASKLGYCITPVHKSFKLEYNTSDKKVHPCFEMNKIKYQLDGSKFDIVIKMSEMSKSETACVDTSYKANKDTLKKIKANAKDKKCWTVANNITKMHSAFKTTGWYDSEDSAKEELEKLLKTEYNKVTDGSIQKTTYSISEDKSTFVHRFGKKADKFQGISNRKTETKTVNDGNKYCIALFTQSVGNIPSWSYTNGQAKFSDGNSYTTIIAGSSSYHEKWETVDGEERLVLYYTDTNGKEQKYQVPDGIKSYNVTRCKRTQYKLTGKTYIGDKCKDTYTRNCRGHEFEYCGGHLSAHSQGVVFSASNEQLAMGGMCEFPPVAKDYDLEANGYTEIRGEYVEKEIDYSSEYTASTTGGCKKPLEDIQGSMFGSVGLNLYIEEQKWADGKIGWLAGEGGVGVNKEKFARNIFDIDCGLKKGRGIFPIESYKNYKGWTEENMTLVITRITMDWHEAYGFDIPLEIGDKYIGATVTPEKDKDGNVKKDEDIKGKQGGYSLSTKDIKNIINALKNKYGSKFTKERENAIKTTLNWVGRGHYSDCHEDHDFLSRTCKAKKLYEYEDGNYYSSNQKEIDGKLYSSIGSIQFDGNCTASDEVGFTNYIYNLYGKKTLDRNRISKANTFKPNSTYSNVYPADVVIHSGNINDFDMKGNSWVSSEWNGDEPPTLTPTTEIMKEYSKITTAIYIGTLDEDLKLSTCQVLEKDTPIFVELTSINNIGNIYLLGKGAETPTSYDNETVPYWLVTPDKDTKVYSFK